MLFITVLDDLAPALNSLPLIEGEIVIIIKMFTKKHLHNYLPRCQLDRDITVPLGYIILASNLI